MQDRLILIPAYNAGPELRRFLHQLEALHLKKAVLIVDDGSETTDYADLREAGWRVERFPHGGKGSALRHGFEIALREGRDWVITMDADGQHAPGDLPAFFHAIEAGDADLIVGNRMDQTAAMPWLRRLTNRFTSWLLRRLTGVSMHDVQSGYRAIHRSVLESVPLTTSHFDTEIEQLIRTARRGFRIGEVRVQTIYNEGQSFISKFWDTYRFVRICLKLLFTTDRRPGPPSRPAHNHTADRMKS